MPFLTNDIFDEEIASFRPASYMLGFICTNPNRIFYSRPVPNAPYDVIRKPIFLLFFR
jgi:hypothetical protein